MSARASLPPRGSRRASAPLPQWLRGYAVEQDYAAYTEADHRVWRTVLRGIHDRLARTAHPAYVRGLEAAGMRVDRIPRITEMDAKLAELGWGAVAVDGFIPPRAFQALQAHRVLPISAAIRRPDHLEYTPAPDILHEAAGHAPILADPGYAAFVERIGALGARTFSAPADREAYEAIRHLSIVKEAAESTAAELEAAEQRLDAALAADGEPSEAARLARLYWWTVEYGLLGAPDDYRLYGAGLLSSLGESASCHRPEVKKLRLSAACADVPYDITREQAQLFVAEDFRHLHDVLDEVMERTAYRRGGLHALEAARRSEEPAGLVFESGAELAARVEELAEVGAHAHLARLGGALRLRRGGYLPELRLEPAALLHTPERVRLYALAPGAPLTLEAIAGARPIAGEETLGRALSSAAPLLTPAGSGP
jgi:phenylalanine-4-hydroxylase